MRLRFDPRGRNYQIPFFKFSKFQVVGFLYQTTIRIIYDEYEYRTHRKWDRKSHITREDMVTWNNRSKYQDIVIDKEVEKIMLKFRNGQDK